MIYLGADHRGFEIKNNIFKFLKNSGLDVKDVGAYNYDPKDDYNDFAVTVARAVRREKESCGILICGSGIPAYLPKLISSFIFSVLWDVIFTYSGLNIVIIIFSTSGLCSSKYLTR